MTSRTRPFCVACVSGLLVLLHCEANANAQTCQMGWVPYFTQSIDGPVNCSVLYDPDGVGPAADLLVIGGSFDTIEGMPVGHIAAWDGRSWQPLAKGVSDEVLALTVFDGNLIAAGKFTAAGNVASNYVARWDGTEWHALGVGLNSHATAACAFGDSLFVGGYFSEAGGVVAQRIARWDSETWHPVGDGFSDGVLSFTEFEGALVAGGLFTHSGTTLVNHIARLDGLTWQPLGGGVSHSYETPAVRALAVLQGQLVAAGNLTPYDVMSWNGTTWSGMSANLDCDDIICSFDVHCLTFHDGYLHAAGWVGYGGANPVSLVARRWDGQAWQGVAGSGEGIFHTAISYNGQFIVGGNFFAIGQEPLCHLASLSPGGVTSMFTPNTTFEYDVNAFFEYEGDLIAGGWFWIAPGAPAKYVARWDGINWHPMGPGTWQGAYAFTSFHGDLIAGTSGGMPVQRWTASNEQWETLSPNFGQVRALAEYNGELYAGGLFNFGGAINIARWDGAAWLPVAGGLNGFVRALIVYNNELFIGGDFTYSSSHIVRWDGTQLSVPASGIIGGGIHALTIHQGDLIAAGLFGNGDVRRWNGTSWSNLGTGLSSYVYSLASYNGQLYAGARYINVMPNYPEVARWNGATWTSLDNMNGDVNALLAYNGELMVGGRFTAIGTMASPHWARWRNFDAPTIVAEPESLILRCVDEASFTVLASGVDLSYQWQHDGRDMIDGVTPYGSKVSGSTLPTLIIVNVTEEDFGAYNVTVTNTCGTTSSNAAMLTWQQCGDTNGDGSVNVVDLLSVINDWGPCPTPPSPCESDMSNDGLVNVADLLLVIDNWG